MRLLINQITVLVVGIIMVCPTTEAQNKTTNTEAIQIIATQESTYNWFELQPSKNLSPSQLVSQEKTALGLGESTALIATKTQTDPLGYTHHRFRQTFCNIPVEGAELVVHEKNGRVQKANGRLVRSLTLYTVPTLTQIAALDVALANIDADQYAWENETLESTLQYVTQNPAATYFPNGELVIVSPNFTQNVQDYRLAYKFDIYAHQPLLRQWVFIDAHNGTVITTINQLHDTDTPATGNAQYTCNNPVPLTCSHTGSHYRLQETGRGNGINTYNAANTTNYARTDFTDTDTHFEQDPTAVEIHWATEMTYDYFLNEFGRNSFDDNGAPIISWLHFDTNYNNAFWNGQWFTYGDGDGTAFGNLSSIDVVAHEFTHALTGYTADLAYAYESGALNESFSDIFATMIEFYAEPSCANWILGENVVTTPGKNGLRNMADPHDATMLTQQPNTYLGNFWHTAASDNGGVHINSGVQNYWFYLLSEGGSGTNDNGYSYNITGMGIDKAAKVAYRTLTAYLTSTSNYVDARQAAISAAQDLVAAGILTDAEAEQVAKAWCAVGVGTCDGSSDMLTISSPNGNEICEQSNIHLIQWNSTGSIGSVDIDYSLNEGVSWNPIIAGTANDGTFEWLVPNAPSALAKIRIRASNNPSISDVSNAVFTIDGCSTLAGFTTATNTICSGETLPFINTSLNASSVTWSVNGVAQSSNFQFDYTFLEIGLYEVTLMAQDGNCTDTYHHFIAVFEMPNADFNFHNNGLEAHFFAPENELNASYNWTFDDHTSTLQNPVYTFPAAGDYTVCLTVATECNNSQHCKTIQPIATPVLTFQTSYGGSGKFQACFVSPLDNGDYLMMGEHEKNGGFFQNKDIYVLKTDFAGNVLWSNTYKGLEEGHALSAVPTQDGGFVIVGYTGSHNNSKIFALKLNTNGQKQWLKNYDGGDKDIAHWVTETSNGDLVIAGETHSYSTHKDAFVLKTDANGTILWFKTYGGNKSDKFTQFVATNDGGFAFVGTSASFNVGYNKDVYLVKTDADGTEQWAETFGGYSYDGGAAIAYTQDEGFIVSGTTFSFGLTEPHIYLLKISSSGSLTWSKAYKSDLSYSVSETEDGGFVVAGGTYIGGVRMACLIKTSANSDFEWMQSFQSVGMQFSTGYSSPQLSDGGFALVGNTSNQKAYFIKTDSEGETGCVNFSVTPSMIAPTTISNTVNSTVADFSSNLYVATPFNITNNLSQTATLHCINNLCQTTAHFEATDTEICRLQEVTFTNTSTDATAYEWFINGIAVSNTQHLTHLFEEAGNYTVVLLATDGNCEKMYEQNITVSSNHTDLDLPSNLTICQTELPHVLDAGTFEMASYAWYQNGLLISSKRTAVISSMGNYTLVTEDFCQNTATETIAVAIDQRCVWPGDYNYDKVVNHQDLLSLGLAFGAMGTARPNASLNWEAQASADWTGLQLNNENHKQIDGDGNGILDLNDISVIEANYGKSHGTPSTFVAPSSSPLSLTPILETFPTEFSAGTSLEIDLTLDNSDNVPVTAYGLAFDINYSVGSAGTVTNVTPDYSNSQLGTYGSDMIGLSRSQPSNQHIALAMTRIDLQNSTAEGKVATLIVEVDVIPTLDTLNVTISIDNIQLVVNSGSLGEAGITVPVIGGTTTFKVVPTPNFVTVQPKVFLEGPYHQATNLMRTTLLDNQLLPLAHPYNRPPWAYSGTEHFATIEMMPSNMVDWVLLEARSATDNTIILESHAAILLNDGSIVDVDGVTNGVRFFNLANNEAYYLVIRHHNHLAVMSASAIPVQDFNLIYDFTTDVNQALGNTQLANPATGVFALYAADFTSDGLITVVDFNYFSVQTSLLNKYIDGDCNLDGSVTIADFNFYQKNSSVLGVSQIRY